MSLLYEEFSFRGFEGQELYCDLRYLQTENKKPIIIFIHGFKGFKDWGCFPYVRTELARSGFVSVGINFSHNGIGADLENFTELDKFASNTFTRELNEVASLLAAIERGEIPGLSENEYDKDTILLLGHSRGAAEAILAGSHHPAVKGVCAWAPVSRFDRYTERQRLLWKERGYLEIENSRTGQTMRLNASLLEDIERHADRVNIVSAATILRSKHRALSIITGSEDLIAPLTESEELASAYGDKSILNVIPKTGHTFGASHPYASATTALETVLELTIGFFKSISK